MRKCCNGTLKSFFYLLSIFEIFQKRLNYLLFALLSSYFCKKKKKKKKKTLKRENMLICCGPSNLG